jgi:hypothetical protein
MLRFAVAAALMISGTFTAPAAFAQATATSPCTQWIQQVPYDITAPGHYCLKQNIQTDQIAAISIYSSDVTLDCRGRSITHTDPGNDAFGINGGGFGPVHDVTIRSCKLVDFSTGITFGPGSDRIEIANNDIVRHKIDGIVLWGSNSRIVGNTVLGGHNTYFDFGRNITVTAFEPGVRSANNVISGNVVAGAKGNGTIWAIRVDMSDNALINNNTIMDLQPTPGGYAMAIASEATDTRILNNVMMARTGDNYGNMGNAALCSRNLAIGLVTDGFQWCTQAINNTTQP